MLIERRLQVTKKKNVGGLSMKSLEANISVVGDGKDEKVRFLVFTERAFQYIELTWRKPRTETSIVIDQMRFIRRGSGDSTRSE